MENIGKHMAAKELQMKPENVYLWNVYTDVDFRLRRNHIQTKATKRRKENVIRDMAKERGKV